MRCPKCQYISFESSDRCRNCGYEFALAVDVKPADLPIQTGDEALGPLNDFTLSERASRPGNAPAAGLPSTDNAPADSAPISQPRPITSSFDLPLFRDRSADDAPRVVPPAAPRPPLAVRRSTPAARVGPRGPIDEPQLDLVGALLTEPVDPPSRPRTPDVPAGSQQIAAASPAWRIVAALVDGAILGAIGLVILYLTLRICGLTFSGLRVIPPAPFVSFLLLIVGGYFTLFVAANGQTIGKMAAGVKVVPSDVDASRVSLGHAVVRAAAYVVSALPAGLGFLPALFGADHRAIHDRLAATRVVKA